MATDVIIVGGGPVGVTAAHLLGRHGLSTLVIERGVAPYDLPRAIHMDHEIMRIFQSAGLAELLLPHFAIPQGSVHFGADGAPIRPFRRMFPTSRYGWANDYFFYQPDLEDTLRAALADRPSVEFLGGHAVVGIEQAGDGVAVTAEGAGGTIRAEARYVLGCDGGKSTVRRLLGIGLTDLGFDEPWIVVDAVVPGKVRMPAFSGLPDDVDVQKVMFIIGDPARPTSYVPSSGDHRRWEFMLLPHETPEQAARPEMAAELLRPWLGDEPYTLVRSAVYRFHSLLAERWQDGRVFLLGDAAHQTPPFFGQGLCHGIRDAANLAWKLDMVLRRGADPSLLATYQPERLPHARAVIETSMRTGRYVCTLDPAAARRRDADMRANPPGAGGDIIPPLAAGILDRRPGQRAAGLRFIQPSMTDGKGDTALLDDLTGAGFLLLSTNEAALDACADTGLVGHVAPFLIRSRDAPPARLPRGLIDDSGELSQWLAGFDRIGVIVRPDRYVYGTFADDADARSLAQGLAVQLFGENGICQAPAREAATMTL